jgi:predicted Zn-dependent protease
MSIRPPSAILTLVSALLLSACVAAPPPQAPPRAAPETGLRQPAVTARSFLEVAREVEPVAEAFCRAETPDQNCDFAILVDRDPEVINAFQTIDRNGRPVVILTLGLVSVLDNADELAFVIGHEAAHHIARHIPEQRDRAAEGARIFSEIAAREGFDPADVERAAQLGAFVGARSYSREAELEADALGAVIAFRAGYDPVTGARLFSRLPEPSTRLLSTHPPNAQRMATVRRAVQGLR